LFHEDYGVAGTTDLIEVLPANTISLGDYKTNAKGITKYSWGRRMMYPLDHIFDANYYHYEIQMSTYAFMLEEAGWWVKEMTIYYINMKKGIIERIPMQNRRNDVINMLEHYRENYSCGEK